MANVVQTKVMQYHGRPVRLPKFVRNMSGDIIVYLRKVLAISLALWLSRTIDRHCEYLLKRRSYWCHPTFRRTQGIV